MLGRTQFLEEIIRRTAWGVDFDLLETEFDAAEQQHSTITKMEPPRYYAGLRVRGKFRRDWARQTAPSFEAPYHSTKVPIALLAAYYGNPKTIEWIFSDRPVKAIEKFIQTHETDKRAAMLENVGWRKQVAGWFGTKFFTNRDNAFHAAIMGKKVEGIDAVFEFFIKQGHSPSKILESKQQNPKHDSLMISARIGCHFQNIYEKHTVHKRDPTIVDGHGYNILHILTHTKNAIDLNFVLGRLSDSQKNKMTMQRTFRSLYSPISLAVVSQNINIVTILLEQGKEQLHLRDGDGNLPIHTAVANGYAKIVQLLLDADPTTLLVEDTAGSLPIEIAQSQYLLCRSQTYPIANVSQTATIAQSRRSWCNERPELQDAKSFIVEATELECIDNSDAVTTMEVVMKAMPGVDVKERQLVSLLDVTDVIRRAAKFSSEKDKGLEYHTPGVHLTGENSLWQVSQKEVN